MSDQDRTCEGNEHFWPSDYVDGDSCNCGAFYLDHTTRGQPKVIEAEGRVLLDALTGSEER